ncbi:MAG TPA: efflux RND transporter periplasmic adaptor subunit [Ktedonobacterales bacterium]|nr:efflux RND transporter periplasmic adaptor subunit [Ktedonobacterales bacterium]
MLEPWEDPVHGMLDLPGFDDGDETVVTPAVPNEGAPATPWWRMPWWRMPWWRNPWWRSRAALIGGAALLLLLCSGLTLWLILTHQSPVVYQTVKVSQGDLMLSISATGPIQGATYDVGFTGNGKLASINVKVGDTVTAGQTLATLDTTSLQDAFNQAQAAVSAAQTAVSDAQTNQQNVQAQTQAQVQVALDQMQAACSTSAVTGNSPGNPTPTPTATATPTSGGSSACQIATDQYAAAQAQAATQNAVAQTQVDQANGQSNSANAAQQTAQDNLNNATLPAPHAGTIAVINGNVGGTPGGAANGNVFIQIVDLSALQVMANVNETDIGSVATGDPVQFTVSAYGPRQFHGTVAAIGPIGQPNSNVVTYPVTVAIDAAGLTGTRLLPGMTATLKVITAQRFQVLLIPVKAVAFARASAHAPNALITAAQAKTALAKASQLLATLQASGIDVSADNPTPAYVLERVKGKWVAQPVVLGLTDGVNYEVLAGLTAGNTIVTGASGGPYGTPTPTPARSVG